ncbi:hypothetical protein ALC56_08299, partial [Trachymyrmex septentrionalis]
VDNGENIPNIVVHANPFVRRGAGKRAETAAIAGRSWERREKNTNHGSERFKDGCRASLVFLNLYRESGCQPTRRFGIQAGAPLQ